MAQWTDPDTNLLHTYFQQPSKANMFAAEAFPLAGGFLSNMGASSAYGQYGKGLDEATRQMMEQYAMGQKQLSPYAQMGQQANQNLYGSLQQMQDPTAYYNKIMGGYQMSPAAQFQMQQGKQQINADAASRGLLGSTAQGRNLEQFSQGLTSQDMQQYLQNIMGAQGQYQQGMQGLGGQGLDASRLMAQLFGESGQNLAQMRAAQAYAQGKQQEQESGGWGNLLGGIGNLASIFL